MAATPTGPSSTTSTTSSDAVPSNVVEATTSFNDQGSKTESIDNSNAVADCIVESLSVKYFEPSYLDSENSEWFSSAKSLLEKGDFESSLLTIEEGINATKDMILKFRIQNETPKIQNEPSQFVDDLHESLAPFHYLYGTTLLYSIEESDGNQAMTVESVPKESDDKLEDSVDENVKLEGNGNDVGDACGLTRSLDCGNVGSNDVEPDQYESPQTTSEETTEDIQIAWENLDLSRAIIENMLEKKDKLSDSLVIKLSRDLAQVYLRAGDLQRTNSKYESSISDYDRSLRLMLEQKDQTSFHDRKIADAHYNLGLTHFMMVAAATASSKPISHGNDGLAESEDFATQQKERYDGDDSKTSSKDVDDRLNFARGRGYYHYVKCSMILGGILASCSNIEPRDFFVKVLLGIPRIESLQENEKQIVEDPTAASMKVCNLRKHVRLLEQPINLKDKFDEIIMILDDIQETIDEAEKSEEGLKEITEMKEMISAAVAAQGDPNDIESPVFENNSTSSTTTVGFGASATVMPSDDMFASSCAKAHVITTIQGRKKDKKRELPVEPKLEDQTNRLQVTTSTAIQGRKEDKKQELPLESEDSAKRQKRE